jgi:hypothetical protein
MKVNIWSCFKTSINEKSPLPLDQKKKKNLLKRGDSIQNLYVHPRSYIHINVMRCWHYLIIQSYIVVLDEFIYNFFLSPSLPQLPPTLNFHKKSGLSNRQSYISNLGRNISLCRSIISEGLLVIGFLEKTLIFN